MHNDVTRTPTLKLNESITKWEKIKHVPPCVEQYAPEYVATTESFDQPPETVKNVDVLVYSILSETSTFQSDGTTLRRRSSYAEGFVSKSWYKRAAPC